MLDGVPEKYREKNNASFINNSEFGVEAVLKLLEYARVVEVDEKTGKIIPDYIHGGLEIVEPNIVQEVLLSK